MAPIPGTEEPNSIEEFVIFIRQGRKSLKLSQSDLAGLCGLTKEGLSRPDREGRGRAQVGNSAQTRQNIKWPDPRKASSGWITWMAP